MLAAGVGALFPLGLEPRFQRFEFPLDELLQLIEAAAGALADLARLPRHRLFQAREARFIIPHLGAEEDIANLVDIPPALDHLRRPGFGVALGRVFRLLSWIHRTYYRSYGFRARAASGNSESGARHKARTLRTRGKSRGIRAYPALQAKDPCASVSIRG